MPSIIFVCSANQCRSPMAEALFKAIVAEAEDLNAWRIESAGTWAYKGVPATALARQAMQERSLDIEDHRSRPVSSELLADFDLILVMEDRHRLFLREQFPGVVERVRMFSEIVGNEEDIDDPVMGTLDTYRDTVAILQAHFEGGFDRILEWAVAGNKDRL